VQREHATRLPGAEETGAGGNDTNAATITTVTSDPDSNGICTSSARNESVRGSAIIVQRRIDEPP
jgi:hypothetical protein